MAPVLPIFRSQLQGELLATLLLDPDTEHSLSELARKAEGSVAAVQREVDRLESSGILVSRRVGRARMVRADLSSPLFEPLSELVVRTFGPPAVIAAELADIAGIDGAFLFGSWAARYHGETGPAPRDIDVLVVGSPDRDEVHDAALRAEGRLGRPVNMTVRNAEGWAGAQDGFARQVRRSPIVPLPLRDLREGER